ncbi:complement decay-accelerating factor isoform X2 [Carlito syrichta]|uniref:Complement decay-accelerating factor isoform X2 n=1 Tax=Carlito syrichta TaxID=1868482 RepID=A0A1U7U1M7_CARSF|nr:complement decay-accelerating factor isoform X2 [Carlito syrichta]
MRRRSLPLRALSVAQPSVPAGLCLLAGLSLLLLLCPLAVQGDCSDPPAVPNAQPDLKGLASFPPQSTVTYKCNEGFVKIPDKANSVVCLDNNQWSDIEEFCNRSCGVPTRLQFASLKKVYSEKNYFPVGFTVEYECRLGYRRDPTLSGKLTCLPNLEWSQPVQFCKKKSCPNPGELQNGHINITSGTLFGAAIYFSCNLGYKLYGSTSSLCIVTGNTVDWSDSLPECREIECLAPPEIKNGVILGGKHDTYLQSQTITYMCNKGFTLIGERSIYCTVNDDEGEWSGPPPECKEKSPTSKPPPPVQRPTTVNVPGTKVTTTSQTPTRSTVQATVSRTTKHHIKSTATGKQTPSGAITLIYGDTCLTLTVLLSILVSIG